MELPNGVLTAISAARAATTTAQTTAEAGTVQGRLGYLLTKQVVGDNKAELVFPLIALSSAAIVEGLTAYTAETVAWGSVETQVQAAMALANERAQQAPG